MISIEAPDFKASIDCDDGGLIRNIGEMRRPVADDHVAFMRTWSRDEIIRYCEAKGWNVTTSRSP